MTLPVYNAHMNNNMDTNAAAVRLLLIDAISELHNWTLGTTNNRAHKLLNEAIKSLDAGDNVKALYNIEKAMTCDPDPAAERHMIRAAARLAS